MDLRDYLTSTLPDGLARCSEVVLRVLVHFQKSIEPDIRWTVFYVVLLSVSYLFHSPFRAHSAASLDSYARIIKVMQTWSIIVLVCFHVGPKMVREKREQLAQYAKSSAPQNTEDDAGSFAGVVFFPMFLSMTAVFLFLHKMKRRWRLAVTFGSSLTMVLMNSLLMSILSIMHYTYSRRLFYFEEAAPPDVPRPPFVPHTGRVQGMLAVGSALYSFVLHSVVRRLIITPSMATRPFEAVFKLELLCCFFISCDYRYKKRQGGDPTRGILWADQYDYLKRGNYYQQQAEEGRRERGWLGWKLWWRSFLPVPEEVKAKSAVPDWRDLEPKPRSFREKPSADSRRQSQQQRVTPQPSSVVATPQPTTCNAQGEDVPLRHREERSRERLRNDKSRFRELPLLYNETPVDLSRQTPRHRGDEGTQDSLAVLSPVGSSPAEGGCGSEGNASSPRSIGDDTASILSASGLVPAATSHLTNTVVSFKEKASYVREKAEARHPQGKPGMVPWWSSFSIGTAWQGAINSSLKFLSFDVRTIQELSTPKVFSLHFVPHVKHIYDNGDLASCVSGREDATASPCAGPTPVVGNSSIAFPNTAPPTDVWFDWIADVGDGFNPTYEMARLMAQPVLRMNPSSSSRKRRSGGGSAGSLDNELMNEDFACEILPPNILGSSDDDGDAAAAARAPTHRRSSAPSLVAPATARQVPPPPPQADAAEGRSRAARAAGGCDAAQSQPLVPTTPDASSAVVRPTIGRSASITLGGATHAGTPGPQRQTLSTPGAASEHGLFTTAAATTARRDILPRGSFVLVGGDLAYPLPTDETYSTRLFDPYTDAFSGSHKLKKLFHAQQRNVVAPDPLDDDVAHITMIDAATVAKRVMGGASALPARRNTGTVWESANTTGDDEGEPKEQEDAARRATATAATTAARAKRRKPVGDRVTAAEALHTVPMLFSIPGNHDWFDGLGTFGKWIVEKTWIGGWLMPQRSSFFVLKLPYNWFILCMDTGNEQDINIAQRNYFHHIIEKHMNTQSCVILTCHEPGWLFNAMEHRSTPLQPEIDAVVRHLGARMRLRIAGDIHHYSRHVPVDPVSEAATLIVSGGGGAYMYGARDDQVIEQGTRYVRAGAFPRKNTYMSMASRLWGFRMVNWKFDIIIGICCFGMIYSILPIPFSRIDKLAALHNTKRAADGGAAGEGSDTEVAAFSRCTFVLTSLIVDLWGYLVNNGIASFIPIGMFYMCFNSAGADRNANVFLRALYGGFWTAWCVLCCCGAVSVLYVMMQMLRDNDMLASTSTKWDSFMERELRVTTDAFWTYIRDTLGNERALSLAIAAVQEYFHGRGQWLVRAVSVVVRALDPVETLYYLSLRVTDQSALLGHINPEASRLLVSAYYAYVLFFYWILVTPLVSFIIGLFLVVSATAFDFMYDGSYSALQIEDFKHFLRFRIDCRTRQLHGYVIAEKKVPKVWELNRAHVHELAVGERRHLPPHLRFHPSRWIPSLTRRRRARTGTTTSAASTQRLATADVLEHFVITPHRTAAAAGAELSSAKLA